MKTHFCSRRPSVTHFTLSEPSRVMAWAANASVNNRCQSGVRKEEDRAGEPRRWRELFSLYVEWDWKVWIREMCKEGIYLAEEDRLLLNCHLATHAWWDHNFCFNLYFLPRSTFDKSFGYYLRSVMTVLILHLFSNPA